MRLTRCEKLEIWPLGLKALATAADYEHHNHHEILSNRKADELQSTTWKRMLVVLIRGDEEDEPRVWLGFIRGHEMRTRQRGEEEL
ncbi:hypothetical protein Bca52824_000214 [Brassica carinata]|uniref:Uncharacterized protein n=1 Tax=Brassica carinata TaxID=52824 RepID=A0A8X8B8R0_BRACI|nr:hypothetical protein Bca52824_000214 [Brassica carinata]